MLTPLQIAEATAGAALAAGLAVGGYVYASRWPASRLFGSSLIAPGNPDQIALTFDDGPNPDWTPQLLDVLARHQVRASFFLIGQYAAAQRSLVQRIHAEGHLIGNHSWSHPNLAWTSSDRTREELARTSAELEQIIGEPIVYFRPPFGARRPETFRLANELGLTPVLWNAIGNDWKLPSAQAIADHLSRLVAKNQRNGFATNVVLHDGSDQTPIADRSRTIAAAAQLIEEFAATHHFVDLDAWNSKKRIENEYRGGRG